MTTYQSGISFAAVLIVAVALAACSRDGETADTAPKQSTSAQATPDHSGQLVKVSKPWIRANPLPGRPSAAFFDVQNASSLDDTLIGISLPGGGRAELHTHKHEDGVMRMLKIDSIAVPAGGRVAFRSGGHHVMLFDLPTVEVGGRLAMVLHFEEAGDVDILADIQAITGTGPSKGAVTP